MVLLNNWKDLIPKFDFNEYEAFCDFIREANITMRITSLEESTWTLQSADAGSLRLQHGYEGGGSIAEGVTLKDGWVFYHQSHPGHTNGQAISRDEVFVTPPGSEFCLVCHPAHNWRTVFVPTSLLFASPKDLEFASCAKPQLLKSPPQLTLEFTSLVHHFLAIAEARPLLLSSPVAVEAFQNELLDAVKTLFLKNQHSTARQSARWLRQAKSALEFAINDFSLSLSISDLAKTSCVPERTLRNAFQHCYGLSPKELIRIFRMNQARQLLLGIGPDQTTVTRIALNLVFGILGDSPVRIVNFLENSPPPRCGSPVEHVWAFRLRNKCPVPFARNTPSGCSAQKVPDSYCWILR